MSRFHAGHCTSPDTALPGKFSHMQLDVLCRSSTMEVRSVRAIHLQCTASTTMPHLQPLVKIHSSHPNWMAKITSAHLQQPLSEACAASKIGFQSLPRQRLDGFTSHPAMADASIHLAAVPDGSAHQPTRVPVGLGCAQAAPGAPPASCWSVACIMPDPPGSPGPGVAPPTSSMHMQPAEVGGVTPHSASRTRPQATLVIAALSTKPMLGTQQGAIVTDAASEAAVKDVTFDVQWQTHAPQHAHHVLAASHRPAFGPRSQHLQPIWQHGHLVVAGSYRSSCSRGSGSGQQPLAPFACPGKARRAARTASATACALQMQAMQACVRLNKGQNNSETSRKVLLTAPTPANMQQQLCGYTRDQTGHVGAVCAMALLRVAAVESGSMRGWRAEFHSPAAPPASMPSQPAGRDLVSGGYGDAFGEVTHAGAALQPRLLPVDGALGQAASPADSGTAAGWRHGGMGTRDLERVLISGGMGALGALVATWILSVGSGNSQSLLLGRSGRFPSESVAAFMKVPDPASSVLLCTQLYVITVRWCYMLIPRKMIYCLHGTTCHAQCT